MAKSGLDTELRHSAERTSESILDAAQADAKRLGTESERVVEDRRREVLKDKEAEYGAEARVAIAAERHAAMRAVLLARTHLVDRVLERAQALLPDVARNEAYLATLSSELTDALQFVEAEGTVVRCSEDLGPSVRDRMRDRPAVKVEPEADVGTGFVVVGAEGSVVVDGRLETRIDRLASVLAIEIHTRLQEEP
jgi:vacuolar-type H+-ATPase subunit E/Vma4